VNFLCNLNLNSEILFNFILIGAFSCLFIYNINSVACYLYSSKIMKIEKMLKKFLAFISKLIKILHFKNYNKFYNLL